MSTYCNIRIIRGENMILLFHQHNGYPEYIGKYLLDKYYKSIKNFNISFLGLVNELIKAVDGVNFEIATRINFGCEYFYEINLDIGTLKCFKTNIEIWEKINEIKKVELKEIDLIERLKNK